MRNLPETWTLKGLLSHLDFVHHKMPDTPFAWVLGAGASKPSGIPTGGELVNRWLRELHERLDTGGLALDKWATATNLVIEKFEYSIAASFYPKIYERRFCNNPEEGHACLEDLMAGIEPSPGYSILAKIMEKERHRIVITTNFDNLVADALSIYTETYPFVCGHESLTSFVRVAMRRPLVCKIHRDLLLGPKNDTRSLKRLHEAWAGTLRTLLSHHTPIFVGYGGNDDSLMDLLESLDPGEIHGRLIWCYYEKSEPSERICELVTQHRGALVPVPDFDVLMVLVGAKMGIEPLDHVLGQRAASRLNTYQQRILGLDTTKHPELIPALESVFKRADLEWLTWELKARAEPDLARREKIYRDALLQHPSAADLHERLASLLGAERQKLDEAEQLYRRALELAPNNSTIIANFALFLHETRRNMEEAERYYHKALSLAPRSAVVCSNFAQFLNVFGKDDEAEQLHRRAMGLDPKNSHLMVGLASFLWNERANLDEAEQLLRSALEFDPKNIEAECELGDLLRFGRRNVEEAERMYQRSQNNDPSRALPWSRLAELRLRAKMDAEAAEKFYLRAMELAPNETWLLSQWGSFIYRYKGDRAEAERLYRHVLHRHPSHGYNLLRLANLLFESNTDAASAEEFYRRALVVDPSNAPALISYAGFLLAHDRLGEALSRTERALEVNVWHNDCVAVEGQLYLGIIALCSKGDDEPMLNKIRLLFESGFERNIRSFEPVLRFIRTKLTIEDAALYEAISVAVNDANRTNDLARFPRWQAGGAATSKQVSHGPVGQASTGSEGISAEF